MGWNLSVIPTYESRFDNLEFGAKFREEVLDAEKSK